MKAADGAIAARPQPPDDRQLAEIAGRFGLWRMDLATWTAHWSVGVAHIAGCELPPNGELSIDEHLSFFHPDDRATALERLRNSVTPPSFERRYRFIRPDGELREIIVQGTANRDEAGRLTALHGIALDVTEMSRLEQRERESSDLLRATLENIDQGILMVGPDHKVRVHNRRARELFDVPENLLYEGAPFSAIVEHLATRGEYAGWSDEDRRQAEITSHGAYQRRLQSGTVLEVRTSPLEDGGVVRTITDVTDRDRVLAALGESERRFRLLAEHTLDVIIWCDMDSTWRYVSPAAKTLFGYEPDELVGRSPIALVHPADAIRTAAILDDIRHARLERGTMRQRCRRKDGAYIWVDVSFSLMFEPGTRDALGWVAVVRDMSERKAAEDALRISEERLALALDSGSDGFWDCDLDSRRVDFSGRWSAMLGYGEEDKNTTIEVWRGLVHPEDRERTFALFREHFAGRASGFDAEYRVRSKAGEYVWTHGRGKIVARDAQGRATRMVGTHSDITKRKRAESMVAHMAAHDALTGLPNRVQFGERLRQAIAEADRHGYDLAVLACDLDGFKAVNDGFGHAGGDALLVQVADRLREVAARGGDTVARLGGDEFAVVLRRSGRADEAGRMAERLIATLERPFQVEGCQVTLGMCVGIATGRVDGLDAEALCKRADKALYRAKAAGRNTYRFFEQGMDASDRKAFERDLREAVARGALHLYYQPVIGIRDGRINGFEALLRWRHPVRGDVLPSEVIPLAEEAGLAGELGGWVLREACRQAAAWPDVRVAVNVSALQLRKPEELHASVTAALAQSGLQPGRLELDVAEGALVHEADHAVACLRRLRGLGARVALDDFGARVSSLAHLRRFPLDTVKIDGRFVRDVDGSADILQAVASLAGRQGATVIAEGVETRDQFAQVRAAGCDEVQGFLFSRPLPTGAAAELVRASRPALAAA